MLHDKTRDKWQRIAADTVGITVGMGTYEDPEGSLVDIGKAIETSVKNTREWPPRSSLPPPLEGIRSKQTIFEVTLESTLAASHRLVTTGKRPLALNFASAKNPGGGFQNGSRAQEESLAYASALYASLRNRKMYTAHRKGRMYSPYLYDDYIILSPDVPVFRDENGALLRSDQVWNCSFITSPAPNANEHRVHSINKHEAEQEIKACFKRRLCRVLTIAQRAGYEDLVLGAWGCGVFGCDPVMVADLFYEALTGKRANGFHGCFRHITFAIREPTLDHPTVKPFVERFGSP